MKQPPVDENVIVNFGKHKGTPWTQIPISYLKWLINEGTGWSGRAYEELHRRGAILEHDLELSGHAIDRVSTRFWRLYLQTRRTPDDAEPEGIYSWLLRMAGQAKDRMKLQDERIEFNGMIFIFKFDQVNPTLVTVAKPKPKDEQYK